LESGRAVDWTGRQHGCYVFRLSPLEAALKPRRPAEHFDAKLAFAGHASFTMSFEKAVQNLKQNHFRRPSIVDFVFFFVPPKVNMCLL
jgi:hypothetical protein